MKKLCLIMKLEVETMAEYKIPRFKYNPPR